MLTHTVTELAATVILQLAERSPGAVLCFLPGWEEIAHARRLLEAADPPPPTPLSIHALHSSVSMREQRRALRPPAAGTLKVVLATSLAQTSLTIDDATAVVDGGLARLLRFDARSRTSALVTEPISRADAIQRLGRVGRVAPGACYRLYSRAHADAAMAEQPEPEVRRRGLEALMLQAKALLPSVDSRDVLTDLLDPPARESVDAARERLTALGALTTADDAPTAGDASSAPAVADRMTALGAALSRLPVEPAVGRMALLGVVLGHADEALRLAAVLSAPRGVVALARLDRGEGGGGGGGGRKAATSDVLRALQVYESHVAAAETRGDGGGGGAAAAAATMHDVRHVAALERQLRASVRAVLGGEGALRGLAAPNRDVSLDAVRDGLICAAMPGVAHSRAHDAARRGYMTRTVPAARVHSSSVNARTLARDGTGVWLAYQTQLDLRREGNAAGGTPTLLVTSQVSPLQLALFGGEDFHTSPQLRAALLDRWVVARTSSLGKLGVRALEAVEDTRAALTLALEAALASPSRPLPEQAAALVTELSAMLTAEEATTQSRRRAH